MEKYIYYLFAIISTLGISAVLALRVLFSPRATFKPLKKTGIWIWFSIFIYCLIFSLLAIMKYNAYNMAKMDLGNIAQAIWNTLHGNFFSYTYRTSNICRLIGHTEFVYLLLMPLYWIYTDPKTLLILQTIIISLGAWPVFWLAKAKLGDSGAGLYFALAYLLYPSLQFANLMDFHSDMLATTFLLFTFCYLEDKRLFLYFIFLFLSLLCKEYISFIVIMLGIYILFIQKNIRLGSVTILIGWLWAILTYKLIPGFLGGQDKNLMIGSFAHLGSDYPAIFKTILLHPFSGINKPIILKTMGNLILLFLPMGFLCILHFWALAISLPIIIGLIFNIHFPFSYTNHHNGTIIPIVVFSAIKGGQYLLNRYNLKFKNLALAIGVFVLSSSLFANILYGASPISLRFWSRHSYFYWNNLHQFRISRHDKIADRIIATLIPAEVAIYASNHLAGHLSQRETVYSLPYPENFKNSHCIFVDLLEFYPSYWLSREKENLQIKEIFKNNSDFYLTHFEDGLLLFYRKERAADKYFAELKDIDSTKDKPDTPLNIIFDSRLQLIGVTLKQDFLEKGSRQRISYYWRILNGYLEPFDYNYFETKERLSQEYIIMDTFSSKEDIFRLVHLPMYILNSPGDRKPGEVLKETFDFYVPGDSPAGIYLWSLGLYVTPKYYFIDTDNRGLLPGTVRVAIKEIKIE